ncbi:MAG: phosphotransferase [Anaerolineaceae bacterium]|nr:phosphotransferase [Anaerolineaceae bacterium]
MIPVPPEVLAAFAPLYGTTAARLMYFAAGKEFSDGIVYAYPHGSQGRLLKLMVIPLSEKQRGLFRLDERLRFVRYLGENGAPIVFPEFSLDGRLYETVEWEGNIWVGYCMEFVTGKTPNSKLWAPGLFRRWGATIGQLHRLTQAYPSWEASIEPESGQPALTWRDEWESFIGMIPDEGAKEKWLALGEQMKALPVTRDSFGFIHNDPHIWNLLAEGERITLLDFDVANHHWFINDIAIAMQSVLFDHSGGVDRPVKDKTRLLEFLRCFKEGYDQENELAAEWWERLDLFIAYRRILLFTVMNGWISSRPSWLRSWKKMIAYQPEVVCKHGGTL